jgi:hypothetical protein
MKRGSKIMATATTTKEHGTGFDQFTQEVQRNPTLQSAIAEIEPKKGGNHVGLVNVARTFGYEITLEQVSTYKQGMTNRLKNAQYLGTLLG